MYHVISKVSKSSKYMVTLFGRIAMDNGEKKRRDNA